MSSEPVDPHSIITGQPLPLAELLQNTTSPQLRGQLLHAYWELAGEIAKYKILYFKETQISSWVRELLNKRETDSARVRLFQSAEKWANEERKTAELQVLIKQNELAALQDRQKGYGQVVFANEPQGRELPIPCDFPLVVPYNTQANQMVQYRQLTTKALSLDKRIPLQQRLIVSKTGAVAAGEEYFNTLLSAGATTDAATTDALIFTLGQTAALRCELIDEIVEYNREIADYVTETISPEISGRRLLAMLIQLNPADPNSNDPNETSRRSQPLDEAAEIANQIPTVETEPLTTEFDGTQAEPIQQAGGRAEPPRNLPAAHFQPYHNDPESRFPVE